MAERCCKKLFGPEYSFKGSLCRNPAKVEVDGRWYCGTHNPENVAKRRARDEERWKREREASEAAHRRRLELAKATADVIDAWCQEHPDDERTLRYLRAKDAR